MNSVITDVYKGIKGGSYEKCLAHTEWTSRQPAIRIMATQVKSKVDLASARVHQQLCDLMGGKP